MSVYLKTEDEIDLMRRANRLVGRTLAELAKHIKPGVTTSQLDKIAGEFIRDHGAIPTFKDFPNPFGDPFPANICTSVNDVVVHGVPDDKTVLREGDVISIDCGTLLDGFNGDSCYTFAVGPISHEVAALLESTKAALYSGISQAIEGKRLGDISAAIQTRAEGDGFSIVREYTGHGIGRNMHEDPLVRNYGAAGRGLKLRKGMVLAIEPMVNMGSNSVFRKKDGWTVCTSDHLPAAHFEHTVAIGRDKAEILSSFDFIEN